MSDFSKSYEANIEMIDNTLRVKESFDMLVKHIRVGSRKATFYCIDGFVKDEMFEKMLEYLSKLTDEDLEYANDADDLLNNNITYIESSTESSLV